MNRKIKFTTVFTLLTLVTLLLSSCASAASDLMAEPSSSEMAREGAVYYDEDISDSVQISNTVPEAKRLVIKNGYILSKV